MKYNPLLPSVILDQIALWGVPTPYISLQLFLLDEDYWHILSPGCCELYHWSGFPLLLATSQFQAKFVPHLVFLMNVEVFFVCVVYVCINSIPVSILWCYPYFSSFFFSPTYSLSYHFWTKARNKYLKCN
jgi:hypothetical protein